MQRTRGKKSRTSAQRKAGLARLLPRTVEAFYLALKSKSHPLRVARWSEFIVALCGSSHLVISNPMLGEPWYFGDDELESIEATQNGFIVRDQQGFALEFVYA